VSWNRRQALLKMMIIVMPIFAFFGYRKSTFSQNKDYQKYK